MSAPALFEAHIARGLNHAQQLLEQARPHLPEARDVDFVLQILSYALSLPGLWPQTSRLFMEMAPHMEQAGHREEWIRFLEKAIARSQAQEDEATEAELRLQLGILYRLVGRYHEARDELQASAAHFQALGDARGQARTLHRWASVEEHVRNYDEAGKLVEAALALLAEDDPEQAHGYNILGKIAYVQGDSPAAEQLFSRALRLWEEAGDMRMMAWGLTNLGSALNPQKKYAEAIACYLRAVELFQAIGDPMNEALAYLNWGNTHQGMGQFLESLDLYAQAEPIFRRTGNFYALAILYGNMARARRMLKEWDQAEAFYQISIERSQQADNLRQEIFAREGLGLTYLAQKKREQARDQFEEARRLLAFFAGTPFQRERSAELQRLLQQCEEEREEGGPIG